MFPLPPGFAREEISRARREFEAGAPEPGGDTLAESQDRGRVERNADHLFEHVPVAVPPNAGARIVAGEQDVNEGVRSEAREPRGLFPQWEQPVG